jgi:hypothetical protein
MDVKRCSSCGAEIYWVKTASGASMPIDITPMNVAVIDMVDNIARMKWGYTSHFATCPHASGHRKPR